MRQPVDVIDALRYCIREAASRHEGVEVHQTESGEFRLRIDGERKLHRVPVDIESLFYLAAERDSGFVDHVFDAVNATVERVRADREAAERRQRQAPQWSPYR